MDDTNKQGKNVEKPWRYDHLITEEGFLGRKYQATHPGGIDLEGVFTFDDMVELWGLNRFAIKTIAKTTKAARM